MMYWVHFSCHESDDVACGGRIEFRRIERSASGSLAKGRKQISLRFFAVKSLLCVAGVSRCILGSFSRGAVKRPSVY